MNDLADLAVVEPGFSLQTSHDSERMTVRLAGNADMNAIGTLTDCLARLHYEALRLGVREVVCDFNALYFMNSSCFKRFVSWVTRVEALEPKHRYTIRFVRNEKLHWQKRSLDALRCLADKVVVVQA